MLGERTEGRVAQRRQESRTTILAAAWDICRENGLAALSLRELAARVGMQAPSLYSYFGSKDEIYDAMYAEGQRTLLTVLEAIPEELAGRELLRAGSHVFFDFCSTDPTRYQLLFQRVIPGFEPSVESYAVAVKALDWLMRQLRDLGVTDERLADLWTAILTGLTDQQISNDPGGDRWKRLLDEAVDLFCDHAGIT
jgi:AcrR family transcriptional regulator